MSSFFPRGSQGERGQKCSVFLFGQIKSCKPLPVLRDEFPTEFGSQTKTKKKKISTSCYRLSFTILYHNSLATVAVPIYRSCLSLAVVPVYSMIPSTALLKFVGAAFEMTAFAVLSQRDPAVFFTLSSSGAKFPPLSYWLKVSHAEAICLPSTMGGVAFSASLLLPPLPFPRVTPGCLL